MTATQHLIGVLIVAAHVSQCSGILTMRRLDNRLTTLENNLHSEINYRREDLASITRMIEDLEGYVQNALSNHGQLSELRPSDLTNTPFLSSIRQALIDEKMLNSRTRRKVDDVEKLLSQFTNIALNMQTQLDVIVETLKKQSVLQHKQSASLEEISTAQRNHSADLQEIKDIIEKGRPETQTYNSRPETQTYTSRPETKTYNSRPETQTYTSRPETQTYNSRPETQTYTSRQETKTDTSRPETQIYTSRPETKTYNSCKEIHSSGHNTSGSYQVNVGLIPASRPLTITVYCDMKTDGGGWTVFQRRKDGSEDFYRNWSDYEQGFGHLYGEFWLGNKYLSQLTRQCCHELRIDLEDFDGNRRYAKYSKFQIGSTDQNYVLTVDGYSGDAGDSMAIHNCSMFTTKDRDNDKFSDNCAQRWKGAWWYNNCHYSNLNGLYYKDGKGEYSKGVTWYFWLGHSYSLKKVDMKFR